METQSPLGAHYRIVGTIILRPWSGDRLACGWAIV